MRLKAGRERHGPRNKDKRVSGKGIGFRYKGKRDQEREKALETKRKIGSEDYSPQKKRQMEG